MLTREIIEAQVFDIVAEIVQVPRASLSRATDVRNDLKADSMTLLTVTIELDSVFDMEFDEARLPELATLGDIVDYIHETARARQR